MKDLIISVIGVITVGAVGIIILTIVITLPFRLEIITIGRTGY